MQVPNLRLSEELSVLRDIPSSVAFSGQTEGSGDLHTLSVRPGVHEQC